MRVLALAPYPESAPSTRLTPLAPTAIDVPLRSIDSPNMSKAEASEATTLAVSVQTVPASPDVTHHRASPPNPSRAGQLAGEARRGAGWWRRWIMAIDRVRVGGDERWMIGWSLLRDRRRPGSAEWATGPQVRRAVKKVPLTTV